MTAAALSPATGRRFGLKRVCQVFELSRASHYRRVSPGPGPVPGKRGPRPLVSDEQLLCLIREDLHDSPFTGEGHRKVWARLKFGRGTAVGRGRVLRLMRENLLLSPQRARRPPRRHDGEIVTRAPNLMWGTDGTKVWTRHDGWTWVFAAVDHFNSECVGRHVCKKGDRFAALEPVGQAVREQCGSLEREAARGVLLRMDHGSQYLSEHFQGQIKWWGLTPSFAFLEQPQTNGVAERFFRTLKEQIIYGRVYDSVDDLREAVDVFVELYNRDWRIERLGFMSPSEARKNYFAQQAA